MNSRYVACALLSLSFGATAWAAEGREQAATAAASAWLMLVDQAKYDEAWEGLAKDMQEQQTQEAFRRLMASVATNRGRVTARSVNSATDDGQRVVVEFSVRQTKFSAARTTETVTLVQEPDGTWRVTKHTLDVRAAGVTRR